MGPRPYYGPVTLNLDCPQIGSGWNEYFNFWPVILFHAVILGPPYVPRCVQWRIQNFEKGGSR